MHAPCPAWAFPAMPPCWSPGAASATSWAYAPEGMRFIGVELDSLSGRIAGRCTPRQDIRIENFRDTRLPEHRIDAVIGNVPFGDVEMRYEGKPTPCMITSSPNPWMP